jgi:hypothetical protein
MRNLMAVVVLLLACIVGLGFYQGWFHFSTSSTEHTSNATISVDQDKIRADEARAKEKVQDIERAAKK